jgi:hypothetical protein
MSKIVGAGHGIEPFDVAVECHFGMFSHPALAVA